MVGTFNNLVPEMVSLPEAIQQKVPQNPPHNPRNALGTTLAGRSRTSRSKSCMSLSIRIRFRRGAGDLQCIFRSALSN